MSDCDAWEPPPWIKLLVAYAESYLTAFNAIRNELLAMGQPLALYGQELTAAAVVLGDESETAAVIYFTEQHRERFGHRPGVQIEDMMHKPLEWISQWATANQLKIGARKRGDKALGEPNIPEDLPESDLHPALRWQSLKLQPIVVRPRWRSENGVFTAPAPAREHVNSPISLLPDGQPALQFPFPFADLVWGQEELKLDADAGRRLAQEDVEALRVNPPLIVGR